MARDWSEEEVRLTVEDYFDMLSRELKGEPFTKAQHNEALRRILNDRSPGAVERKHMNISAVLRAAGHPFIDGYKPLGNYQALLADVVLERIGQLRSLRAAADRVAQQAPGRLDAGLYLRSDLQVEAPEPTARDRKRDDRALASYDQLPRRFDYPERDAQNRRLGELGEQFVVGLERTRLRDAGRSDLARKVEWTSRERGDGFGYDVQSFEPAGKQVLIEVKTTNHGRLFPFIVTGNEVLVSEKRSASYRLYRVFHLSRDIRFFILRGAVSDSCRLVPKTFRAEF